MVRNIVLILLVWMLTSCSAGARYVALKSELEAFVSDKDARIGVAVIIDDRDTVGINDGKRFPMFSVYKFPIALAFGECCRANGVGTGVECPVTNGELKKDTYSPMLEVYDAVDTVMIPARELLAYALQLSDNNASDILLSAAGGVQGVMRYLEQLGVVDVNVLSSEAEMYADRELCRINSATPLAMAGLMNRFDREFNDSVSAEIKGLMETCSTGVDRLVAPLAGSGAVVGHKTGTGFVSDSGRIMALNDCGYVHLADGHRYSIAIFVEDSGYDLVATAGLIAEISAIVLRHVSAE